MIDDDESICDMVELLLEREGISVTSFTDATAALAAIDLAPPHVVVTDLQMDGRDGIDVVNELKLRRPDVPVLVATGHADLEHAVDALRAGAYDFLCKPLDPGRLIHAVRRGAEHCFLKSEVRRLQQVAERFERPSSIIGDSLAMQRVLELVNRVGTSDASVLITGESGTGKELIARALHERSGRSGAFVAVNCAAMPSSLIESELFGHTRGAFTDARGTRKGLFLEAQGGTLFLDEIGDLPPETQPKLLRALQERKVRPVGGDQEIPFDARLVTATNRVLEDEVAACRFREDLFYRINVVALELPPLRDRGGDILALAQHFIERIAARNSKSVNGLRPETARMLLDHSWPGNVRELENCIDRAVALTEYDEITPADLPRSLGRHPSVRVEVMEDREALLSLGELEYRYIQRVLTVAHGNKSMAARILQIDRRTLHRKLARLEETA